MHVEATSSWLMSTVRVKGKTRTRNGIECIWCHRSRTVCSSSCHAYVDWNTEYYYRRGERCPCRVVGLNKGEENNVT